MENNVDAMYLETGEVYLTDSFKFNCHECGKSIYPLRAFVIPTDFYMTLGDIPHRAILIHVHDNDKLFLCNCIASVHSNSLILTMTHEQKYEPLFSGKKTKDFDWSGVSETVEQYAREAYKQAIKNFAEGNIHV